MNQKSNRKNCIQRILAIILSLLMLLQTCSVFAEDIEIPENTPAETAATVSEDAEKAAGAEEPAEGDGTAAEEADGEGGKPAEGVAEVPEQAPEAPAAEPVFDISESVTMTEAGYVPAPPYFNGTLVYEGADYTVTAIIGPDAMFPEDIQMRVEEILPGSEQYELYTQLMEETLEEGEELGEFARYFDISFIAVVDGVETEIEPQANIDVQITFQETIALTEESDVQAVHIAENTPEILETITDSLEAAVNDDEAIDTVTFSADSFSVYGVVQKIKKILKVITASGESFTVDVTYTSDANIPEDAELIATEITPNDPNYDIYREQTALALGADDVRLPGLFDLGIYVNGEKIQPEAPVSVAISLNEGIQEGEKLYVVHFPEGIEAAQEPTEAESKLMAAPRMMRAAAPMTQPDAEQQAAEQSDGETPNLETKTEIPAVATEVSEATVEGETVTFEANGFSVYALAYTVDFHWEVDGEEYEFSLTGGDSISFRNLVEALGIPEQTEAENYSVLIDRFVANIANIQFSDPALLWVGKTGKETTALEIAEENNLQIEYSDELLDQQITRMQEKAYPAEEWVLMSLKPFTSEEYLTVTMKNEETFIILVTDAQLKKTVIDAKGDTWEITVTYGPEAQIPDGAELEVSEITEGMPGYATLFEAMDKKLNEQDKEYSTVPALFDISIVVNGEKVEPAPNSTVVVEARLVRSVLGSVYSADAPVQINDEPLTEENSSTEAHLRVVHVKNDGTSELVNTEDELSIAEVASAFVTDSFSDWLIYLDEELQNITVGVDDTITLRPYSSWIWKHDAELPQYSNVQWDFSNGNVWELISDNNGVRTYQLRNYVSTTPNATVQYLVYSKYDSQLEETYTVAYGYANGPGEYDIRTTSGKTIHVTVTGDVPDVPPVVTGSANIAVNLFNYDNTSNHVLDVEGNTASNPTNQNVNSGHDLKFLGYGGSNSNNNTLNNYTHANPNQGIVQSTLGSNGYPALNSGSHENLSYLFNTGENSASVHGYANVQGLFQKDSRGYYYYNSNINYAWFDEASNRFVLYEHTFAQNTEGTSAQTGSSNNAKPIGFFPFHRYDAPVRDANHSGMNFNSLLDHHFGMSMQVDFTIPANGKTNEGDNIIYEFSGDDDLWVYVDNQLVLDIGGIHQPVRGYIDFTEEKVYVYGVNGGQPKTFSELGISIPRDQKHTLRMFYLERGGCDSNLSVKFNLPLTLGDLIFTKKDVSRDNVKLKGAVFGLYSDEECTNLVSTATSSDVEGDTYGVVSFKDVPLGNTGVYYLKEIDPPNGYLTSNEVYKVLLKDNTLDQDILANQSELYKWNTETNAWELVNPRMVYDEPDLTQLTVEKHWIGDISRLSGESITVTIKRYKLVPDSQGQNPQGEQKGVLVIGQALADNGAAEHPEYFKVDYTIKKGSETVRTGSYTGKDGATITDLEPGNDYSIECVCSSTNPDYYVGNEQQNRTGITIRALDTTTVAFSNTLTKKEAPAPKNYRVRVMSKDNENDDYNDGAWPNTDYPEGSILRLIWEKNPGHNNWNPQDNLQYNAGYGWQDINTSSWVWSNNSWSKEFGPLTQDLTIKLRSKDGNWNAYYDWFYTPRIEIVSTRSRKSAKMLAAPPSRALRANVSASNSASYPDAPDGYTINNTDEDVVNWSKTVTLPDSDSTPWSAVADKLEKVDQDNNIYVYYIDSVAETGMPEGTIIDIDLAGGKTQVVLGNQQNPGTLSFTNKLLGKLYIEKTLQKNHDDDTSATGTYYYAVYSEEYDPNSPQNPVRTGSITVESGGTAGVTEEDLPFGTYYVYELTGANGTPITGNSAVFGNVYYNVSVTGSPAEVYDCITPAKVSIVNNYNTTNVSVTKAWKKADGTDGAPESGTVTFDLYRDGTKVDGASIQLPITITEGEGTGTKSWVATWNDLMADNPSNGSQYRYTVKEAVDESTGEGWAGYVVTYPNNDTSTVSGGTITNTQQPVTAAPTVTKVFTDLTKVPEQSAGGTGESGTSVNTDVNAAMWPEGGFTFTLAGPFAPDAEDLTSSDYSTLLTDANVIMPDANHRTVTVTEDDRTKTFDDITFKKAGTYFFTVTESMPADPVPGVVYDTDPHHVVITVTENDDGILSAIVSYTEDRDENEAKVTNKYDETEAHPEVKKLLTGRAWKEGDEFTFILTPVDNDEITQDGISTSDAVTAGYVVLPDETTAAVNAVADTAAGEPAAYNPSEDGVAAFADITFKEAGTYTFKITEDRTGTTETSVEGSETLKKYTKDGVTYSQKEVYARFEVIRAENGELNDPVVTYAETVNDEGTAASGDPVYAETIQVFENKYSATGDVEFSAQKDFVNGTLSEDTQFFFTVTQWSAKSSDATEITRDSARLPGETIVNTGNGGSNPATVSFDSITYTEADAGTTDTPREYFYKIIENVPAGVTLTDDNVDPATGIRYDRTERWIKVTVADDTNGNLIITKYRYDETSNDWVEVTAANASKPDAPFTNEQLGHLELEKITDPADSDQTFTFTITFSGNGLDKVKGQTFPTEITTPAAQTEPADGDSPDDPDPAEEPGETDTPTATVTPGTVAVDEDGIATVSLTGGQSILIKNLPVGLTYTITEASVIGWTNTVKVNDTATIPAGQTVTASFTNKYTEISGAPKAQKTLTGRDWLADETFTFELTPDGEATNQAITDGKVVMVPSAGPWTAVADDTDPVSFDEITFKEAGQYIFRIKEIEPAESAADPGTSDPTAEPANSNSTLTYSKKQVLATATVTKDTQTGEMMIDWTYLDVVDDNGEEVEEASEIASFTNTYTTSVTAQIKGTKQVIDPVVPDDHSGYTFTLAGVDGAPVPTGETGTTAISGTDGSFQFAEITYPLSLMDEVTAEAGIKTKVYNYTVTENLPEGITATDAEKLAGYKIVDGIRYDLTEKTVTVTITYNVATGEMAADVDPKQAGLLFTNAILGSVQATKTFAFQAGAGLDVPSEFKITASWSIEGVETPYSVELTPSSDAQTITGTDYIVSAATGSGTAENPSYTWTIENLPVGTGVTFTESGYEIPGFNLSSMVSVNGGTATAGTSGTTSAAVIPGTLAITNTYSTGTELPNTGGIGTVPFTLLGLLLIIAAGAILLLKKRKAC